jgi:hypothetical protein
MSAGSGIHNLLQYNTELHTNYGRVWKRLAGMTETAEEPADAEGYWSGALGE